MRSAQLICHASSMASRSYGAARSVSDHLAVVATVIPGPCGNSFLSVTHEHAWREVVGSAKPLLEKRATRTSG